MPIRKAGLLFAYFPSPFLTLASEKSFENLEGWIKDAREHGDPSISIMVLGNKSDLSEKRKVKKTRKNPKNGKI